jgi:hypothetical protein
MVLDVIRASRPLGEFQFTRRGIKPAVTAAIKILEEGYTHVYELDIDDHFGSFDPLSLVGKLPLPKAAIREIVAALSAGWKGYSPVYLIALGDKGPPGIPQGSASSAAVAEWSVSHLVIDGYDIRIINYADNFFVFLKKADEAALEALRLAIAKLPGGPFETKVRMTSTAQAGFSILGCIVQVVGGTAAVSISEGCLKRFRSDVDAEIEAIGPLLAGDKISRHHGVERYVRLHKRIQSWGGAYAFCEEAADYLDCFLAHTDHLELLFNVTPQEIARVDKVYAANTWKGFRWGSGEP